MTRYAMVVDLDRCHGCRACVEACKVENATAESVFWMYVVRYEEGDFPTTKISFLPRPCQHCDDPPCVKVCPVGARFKRGDGIVLSDPDRCIGCRYCELSCPYGVNAFGWDDPRDRQYRDWDDPQLEEVTGGAVPPWRTPALDEKHGQEGRRTAGGGHHRGVVEKCTFCVHRVEQGRAPACVATCPVRALAFGDRDDPDGPIRPILEERPPWRLLEEAGTEPSVFYVGGRPPGADAREIEAPRRRWDE